MGHNTDVPRPDPIAPKIVKRVLKNRRWAFALVGFAALVIGAGGAAFGLRIFNASVLSAVTNYELSELQNKAIATFRASNPDTSIYAQENLISFIEFKQNLGWIRDVDVTGVTGLAKIRIAINFSECGKKKEADAYYDQALADLKKSQLKILDTVDMDKLVESVRKDRKYLGTGGCKEV